MSRAELANLVIHPDAGKDLDDIDCRDNGPAWARKMAWPASARRLRRSGLRRQLQEGTAALIVPKLHPARIRGLRDRCSAHSKTHLVQRIAILAAFRL